MTATACDERGMTATACDERGMTATACDEQGMTERSGAVPGCYGARPMSAEGPSRDASGDAWSIIAYLLSGLIVWGGAGVLADHLVGTSKVFTLVGLLLGMGSGLYLVYVRFGRA